MSVQAQNALLKTIEEPPEYAVIMLLTENAEEVSCLLTPGELRQMMETSGRPQNEDGPMYYYLWGLAQIRSDDRVCFRETMRMINTRYRFMPAGKEKHDWIQVYLN